MARRVTRSYSALFNGSIVGLPVSSIMQHMMYRRDVLARFGVAPPATWDQLLATARALNGSDFNNGAAQHSWGVGAGGCGQIRLYHRCGAALANGGWGGGRKAGKGGSEGVAPQDLGWGKGGGRPWHVPARGCRPQAALTSASRECQAESVRAASHSRAGRAATRADGVGDFAVCLELSNATLNDASIFLSQVRAHPPITTRHHPPCSRCCYSRTGHFLASFLRAQPALCCSSAAPLQVLASITQTQGTSQGWLFDPDTMQSFVDSPVSHPGRDGSRWLHLQSMCGMCGM